MKKNIFIVFVLLVIVSLAFSVSVNGRGENPNYKALNVVLIWHHHQPPYKIPKTLDYELPWVRMHGVNDYPYMADLVENYLKKGKVVFNITPVLINQLNDYVYNHAEDKYLKLSLKSVKDLTKKDKEFIRNHFFDINPQFVNHQKRYSQLAEKRNEGQPYTDQDYIDLRLLWNLEWINIDYINKDPRLKALHESIGPYTQDDIDYVIKKQYQILKTVLTKYKTLQKEGKIEIMTTPYYHPILPLLIQKGWSDDAYAQIIKGKELTTKIFGRVPTGMWPSEEAVSNKLIPIIMKSGIKWIVTDKGILQKSGVDTGNVQYADRMYKMTENGKTLYVLFRDTDISNRIGFSYSQMSAQKAVQDFIDYLHKVQAQNKDGNLILTIALDGENCWENYPNDGNDFRKLLYETLSKDKYINLTTPDDFIKTHSINYKLNKIATGSWAGDLSTWIGEKEENDAWDELANARKAVLAHKDNKNFKDAMEDIYAAEGSDWFWWYGDDHDSGGLDAFFDKQFKADLIEAYKLIGYQKLDIPQRLFIINKPSAHPNHAIGFAKPIIDGKLSNPKEWNNAGLFLDKESNVMVNSQDVIKDVYVCRDNNNLYVRVDTNKKAIDLFKNDGTFRIGVYTDKPNAEYTTAFPEDSDKNLGFALANQFMVKTIFHKLKCYYKKADPNGRWGLAGFLKTFAVDDFLEIKIPFSDIGVKAGQTFNIAIVAESHRKIIDTVPNESVIKVMLPQVVSGTVIADFKDPIGDDNGPGYYTYPKDSSFAPFKGLFDIKELKVYENSKNFVFQFKFVNMTNPWNAPKGFSHEIINLYIDSKKGGRTDTYHKGANVRFEKEHPWDYFIKVAGWPSYGQFFATADKQESNDTITVNSDPSEKIINIIVPKSAIGNPKEFYLYVLSGSQDGYGPDNFREVTKKASTWTLGGNPGLTTAPLVLDTIVPKGYTQKEVLGSFDKNHLATLVPLLIKAK